MKERGILFSAPMVQALLAGKKTQTRRTLTRVAGFGPVQEFQPSTTLGFDWTFRARGRWHDLRHHDLIARCPYGQPGDRLWCRETWQKFDPDVDAITAERLGPTAPFVGVDNGRSIHWRVAYAADGRIVHPEHGEARWRSGIHMPRWASRLVLEVMNVRVERVQSISEDDSIAEGLKQRDDGLWLPGPCAFPSWAYRELWNQINGPDSWVQNPFVWVVSFRRVP